MKEADGTHSTRRSVLHALAALGAVAAVPAHAAEPTPLAHLGALFDRAAREAEAAFAIDDEAGVSQAMRRMNHIGNAMNLFEPRDAADRAVLARRDGWTMTSPNGGREIRLIFAMEGAWA